MRIQVNSRFNAAASEGDGLSFPDLLMQLEQQRDVCAWFETQSLCYGLPYLF